MAPRLVWVVIGLIVTTGNLSALTERGQPPCEWGNVKQKESSALCPGRTWHHPGVAHSNRGGTLENLPDRKS